MSAYVRQSGRNRETGTLIEVLDLAHPDSEFEPDHDERGGITDRWATVCDTHKTFVTHRTLRLARSHAAVPSGWCEACDEIAEGCTCPRDPADITATDPTCPVHASTGD